MSSKRREVQKAKLGIASLHSSLNLGCFRTVGGPFGTCSGALSGLGLGHFRDLFWGPFGPCWGAFARFRWGAFRSTQGKKEKTTSEKYKASTACTLIRLVGFAHTRRVHAVQKWSIQKGTGPTTADAYQASSSRTRRMNPVG